MQWKSPTPDEHVLCDDKDTQTEYIVRRDPVTCLYIAVDGGRRLMMRMALRPCQVACEERYAAERGSSTRPETRAAQRARTKGKRPAMGRS